MKKLTRKQKGFVKDYIETGNATEAAERNYDVKDRNVANAIGNENLAKPSIRNAIEAALPDELLAKVHVEGLYATKRSGTGAMKIGISADGKVNDFGHTEIDEPDYAVRHKYLDTAYKIKGTYSPERHDIETHTKIIEDPRILEAIRKADEEILSLDDESE